MNWKAIRTDSYWMIGAYTFLFALAVIHTDYQDHQDLVDGIRKYQQKNIALSKTLTPELEGQILGDVAGEWPEPEGKVARIAFVIKIKNHGAPSVVDNWRARITIPDGRVIFPPPNMVTAPRLIFRSPNRSDPVVLYNEDSLLLKSDQLIPTNGQTTGWVMFRLDGLSVSDLVTGTKVELWFQDSLDKEYSLVQTARVDTISGPNGWPGMKVPTSPIGPETRK